jgi:hypothetical protein
VGGRERDASPGAEASAVIALFAEHPVGLFAVRTRARSIVSRMLLFGQLDAEVGLRIRQSCPGRRAVPWIGRTELLQTASVTATPASRPTHGFAVTLISRRPLDRKTRRPQRGMLPVMSNRDGFFG